MMRTGVILMMIVLGAVPAWAADVGKAPAAGPPDNKAPEAGKTGGVSITPIKPGGTTPAEGTAGTDPQVAGVQAMLTAGEFDKAAEAAKKLLAAGGDEATKTEATRLLAESLRKKGDWKQAPAAYLRLRDRFPKGSDDWIKQDAVADLLRASPTGVYVGTGTGAAKTDPAKAADPPKTLADDGALADALTRMATARMKGLKSRADVIRRSRTPQEVVAQLKAATEEARQIFVVSPDVPPDAARELATAAGARLQDLGKQVIAPMEAKLLKYQPKFKTPWAASNVEKKDITDSQATCKAMADVEKSFNDWLTSVGDKGAWLGTDRLRIECDQRRSAYESLAERFVLPKYIRIGGGW